MWRVWTRTGKNLLIRERLSARGHVPNRTRNMKLKLFVLLAGYSALLNCVVGPLSLLVSSETDIWCTRIRHSAMITVFFSTLNIFSRIIVYLRIFVHPSTRAFSLLPRGAVAYTRLCDFWVIFILSREFLGNRRDFFCL